MSDLKSLFSKPANKPAGNAKPFANLLGNPPAKPAAKPATPANAQPQRSAVFGSGLKSRDIERAGRELAKLDEMETSLQSIPSIEDLNAILETELPETLVDPNLQPDEFQQAAIDGLVNEQFGVLIGAAGTGKTTAMKWLIARLMRDNPKLNIRFCAFTGRAVQQMKRALPLDFHPLCDTIHGLLEYAPELIEGYDENGEPTMKKQFIPHRTAMNPLDANCIIVDEAGMCMLELWNNLISACREDTRIYLLGDLNQLPPPMGRSILGFAGNAWPAFELQRIHRTEEDGIINGAWDILHGRMPKAHGAQVAISKLDDSATKAFVKTLGIVQQLHKGGKFHPLTDGVIVPQNESTLGQIPINEALVPYFNPTRKSDGVPVNPRTIITAGWDHVSFAVGDKVMITQNDREQGLTNGMVGIIEAIVPNGRFKGEALGNQAGAHLSGDEEIHFGDDEIADAFEYDNAASDAILEEEKAERERQASHIVRVRFQNIEQPIEFAAVGAVKSLRHAYAFTCHKSQGGEYPTVIIVVHSSNHRMLTREWLYTAWTRAKGRVVLLYNSRGIQQALNRQAIKGRTLKEKFASFQSLQDRNNMGDESVSVPILPVANSFNNAEG